MDTSSNVNVTVNAKFEERVFRVSGNPAPDVAKLFFLNDGRQNGQQKRSNVIKYL